LPKEIRPNLYQIEIPLPETPLKRLNSYLIKGSKRHLLIDTGFNRRECKEALLAALSALNTSPAECDYFITHLHADHSGLVCELADQDSLVYSSREDGEGILRFLNGDHWDIMGKLLVNHGFPLDILEETIHKHPASKGGITRDLDLTFVEDGQMISVGDYELRCIDTSGHTPGHFCLYEPYKKLLFSGDHVLGNITPNITVWPNLQNALYKYLQNLDKIYALDIDLTLPGHRKLIYNCQTRIDEIKAHHEKRLQELLGILTQKPMSAYEAAANMTWDLSYKSWDDFPFPQKWFATGEAAAHLEYLAHTGAAEKRLLQDVNIFSLA